MQLTKQNIVGYLTSRGFVNQSDVVDGNYSMTEFKARNNIFHVTSGDQSLFVKQLNHTNPESVYFMQKDATVHYLIHHTNSLEGMRKFIPDYYGYDATNHVIATEYFQNSRNLQEIITISRKLLVDHGVEMADILSSLHQNITKEIDSNSSLQFFNRACPWIFDLPEAAKSTTGGAFQMIQTDDYLCQQLHQLRKDWEPTSIIHGDIKLTNFVGVKKEDKESIKLIDWEIANIGDPLWDVGGLLHTYMVCWVTHLHQGPNGLQAIETNNYWGGENMHKVLRAFWKQYVSNKGWSKEEEQKNLVKTMRYTAGRLLQSAEELNQVAPEQLSPKAIFLIQMAKNIFQAPEVAVNDFFGNK